MLAPDWLMISGSARQVSPHLNSTWSPGCKFSVLALLTEAKGAAGLRPLLASFPAELET